MKTNKKTTKTRVIALCAILTLIMSCTWCLSAFAAEAQEPLMETSELFTSRDLKQTADLSDAVEYTVADDEYIRITEEGVYVITGTASNATIYVEADAEAKVQLVLSSLFITNNGEACIYIDEADKVFVTTAEDSALSSTGEYIDDSNAVIYSETDLVINGTAELKIDSSANGIVSKDDLKITGSTLNITTVSKALAANDSILIADGTFFLQAGTDGLHAENSNNDLKGCIYIGGGEFQIQSDDDALHAIALLQIDDGTFTISAGEGMEATRIQINGGTIEMTCRDDGINAAHKSGSLEPLFDINDGTLTITLETAKADGIDSNGDIIVNGGTLSINGSAAFDYEGVAEYNGGQILVNGIEVTSIQK